MVAGKFQFLTILWAAALSLFFSSALLASPSGDEVVEVEVQLYLLDLDGIDDVQQNFVASVYLEAQWHDPDLTHDGSRNISRPLSDVWNPRLQIVNQQRIVRSFSEVVEISPAGQATYRQRFWGTFSQPLDLSEFPFDSQQLAVQVLAAGYNSDEVKLVASEQSGASGNYSIADWKVHGSRVSMDMMALGPQNSDLEAVSLTIDVKRFQGYYLVKVVLPLIIIVLMSMLVFWIDPEQSGTQIGVATTAMLTLIAYRFAVGSSLPKLSFLTRLDYFILMSTLLVFFSLLLVIWTSALAREGASKKAQAIDRRSRVVMPVLFLFLTLETLYFHWLI